MDTKTQINRLHQDNISFGIEAVAVNITSLVAVQLLNLSSSLLPAQGIAFYYASIAILALGVLFTLIVMVGNLFRHRAAKRLESKS